MCANSTLSSSTKSRSINLQPLTGSRAETKQSSVRLQIQPSALSPTSGEGKQEETRIEDGEGMVEGSARLPGNPHVYVYDMLGRSCGSMLQNDLLLIKWMERVEEEGR